MEAPLEDPVSKRRGKRPYLILGLRTGELAGWRIGTDAVEPLPLT